MVKKKRGEICVGFFQTNIVYKKSNLKLKPTIRWSEKAVRLGGRVGARWRKCPQQKIIGEEMSEFVIITSQVTPR